MTLGKRFMDDVTDPDDGPTMCYVCRRPISGHESEYQNEPVHPECRPQD